VAEDSLSWHYGFHLAELNYPADSLTCLPSSTLPASVLPLCLGLDSHRYSVVTAIYTAGGLLGSLGSSWLVGRDGVKGGLVWAAWLDLFAVIGMTMAPHWMVLAVGRCVRAMDASFQADDQFRGGRVVGHCHMPRAALLECHRSGVSAVVGEVWPGWDAASDGHRNRTVHCSSGGHDFHWCRELLLTPTKPDGKKGDIPGNWRYIVALSGIVSGIQIATSGSIFEPEMSSKQPPVLERHDREQGLSPVPEADEGKFPL